MERRGSINSRSSVNNKKRSNDRNDVGFRNFLESAVRDEDWSSHVVDYVRFKTRLKYFCRRRLQLKNMILNSPDKMLNEQVVTDLVGPKHTTIRTIGGGSNFPPQHHEEHRIGGTELVMAPYAAAAANNAVATNNNDNDTAQFPPLEVSVHNNNTYVALNDAGNAAGAETAMIQPAQSASTDLDEEDETSHFDEEASSATDVSAATGRKSGGGSSLQLFGKKAAKRSRKNERSILRRLSIAERNEMILFLDAELNKSVMFYLSTWQKLSQQIEHKFQYHSNSAQQQRRRQQQNDLHDDTGQPVLPLPQQQNYDLLEEPIVDTELGDEILELMQFCVMNIVIVQQILVRYDAFAKYWGGTSPLLHYYLKKVNKMSKHRHSISSFRKLWHYQELHAIADEFVQHYSNNQQHPHGAGDATTTTNSNDVNYEQQEGTTESSSSYLQDFQEQRELFADILESLQETNRSLLLSPPDNNNNNTSGSCGSLGGSCGSSLGGASVSSYATWITMDGDSSSKYHHSCWKIMGANIRMWLLQGLFFEDRLFFTARDTGISFTNEMELLADWRRQKNENYSFLRKQQEDELSTKKPVKKLSGIQVYHLTLNLLSAFLYCMNYYIVEPSSTMYVNRLHAHDAMSGTLIGMMPLAAFVSSIPYSIYTNRSFRQPFLLSISLLIVGNLLYSLADQFEIMGIALIGRFISGLGAPKCIIRRYMADTTPMSLRTSVNAGFGMVVAAGSAMGPAMAIILNRFEYTVYFRPLGLITFNGLTLPGYFMACLWTTFGIIVLSTFEEPDREGLKEQKELEARGAIPFSPSNASSSMQQPPQSNASNDEMMSIFSGESVSQGAQQQQQMLEEEMDDSPLPRWMIRLRHFFELVTLPVRICLMLLFCKVFTIESLVSATSALTKNRYRWQVQQVGTLGLTNGILVIPFSILIGRLSMSYQDHVLMKWLVGIGCFAMFLLIDLSDLVSTPNDTFNEGHVLAVSQYRYIFGYFMAYISIQAFEGVIGSTLSKVIPTALASGTFNSGLLATLVDTLGRSCGDLFISAAGFVSLRQLMNLLFIPGFTILLTCLIVIERCRDMLSV